MLTYLGIFLALALIGLAQWSRRQSVFLYGVLYLLLVVFVGARFDTGCDFQTYYWRFQYLRPDLSQLGSMTEPGYFLLSALIKRAGLDFVWVNVISAAIFFFFLFRLARNHPRPFLLIALVFPLLIVQLSMSGLRQALAVAFLMGALDAFIRGRRTPVFLYILLGSTFHQSLAILLPMALMVGRRFSLIRVASAIVILLPVAIYLLSDRIEVYQDRYIEEIYGSMTSAGAIFRLGIVVLTALLFQLCRHGMARLYPAEYNLMQLFALVSIALIPVMLLNTVALHRLIYYVVPMQAYTLAALPPALFQSPRAVRLATLSAVAAYASYILVWFSLSRHATICYVPYKSYLF